MKAVVEIAELEADLVIGAYPPERVAPQRVALTLSLTLSDVSAAAESDRLEGTVNYDLVVALALERARAGRFRLLERCAADLAGAILDAFAEVEAARVTVRKPGAVPGAAYAAATVERRR